MISKIQEFKKTNEERMQWHDYFMSTAVLASCRSPCKRLQVGSVIVKENRVISMGYNGYISGAQHISRVQDDHEQSIVHSEINAITDCAKRGVSLDKSTIYITHYPCINCFRTIAACGIKQIYYLEDYNNNTIISQLCDDTSIKINKINIE